MKHLLRLIFLTLLFITIITKTSIAYADETNEDLTLSERDMLTDGMCINSLDIHITANKDGTLDVVENISAYFLQEADYLIKTIPLEYNKIHNTTPYSRYGNITNLKINTDYKSNYATNVIGNTSLVLKIANPDKTKAGDHKIKISYTYNLLSKPLDEMDELYFDIIDSTCAYYIGKTNFTIKLPKKFKSDNILLSNSSINTLENHLHYKVKGNTINGYCDTIIYPKTGLTIELDLEKNYFNFKSNFPDFINFIIIIIAVISFIIIYILWHSSNKSLEISESLTYYPPKGFNNAEVSLMYKGTAHSIDIASLIIYLANKGYIAIIETDSKKRHYSYKLLKPYTGNNIIEKMLYDGLAKYANKENIISSSDLKDNFFDIQHNIISYLNDSTIHKNMYLKNKTPLVTAFVGTILSLLTIYVIPAFYGAKFNGIVISLLIVAITSILLILNKLFVKSNTIKCIINCIIIGVGYLIVVISNILPYGMIFRAKPIFNFIIPVAILFSMLSGIILAISSTRNKFGTTMLAQLDTLKDNLLKSTRLDFIALSQNNPTYFYDMLPYVYTLDIDAHWLDSFSQIDLESPSWLISESEFKLPVFISKINRTIHKTSEAMSSIPHSLANSKKYLK